MSEGIIQLEKLSTPDEGGESTQAEVPNTRGLAQALLEAAMEVETEDTAVPPPEGELVPDTPIVREPSGTRETRSSLASLLFAACDVCAYCGGKFCTDGTT